MDHLKQERISSPGRTKELLREFGLHAKKSLGQNFLTDSNILDKMMAAAAFDAGKGALEIGPGLGALTERLAQAAKTVVTVEIDRRLYPVLQKTIAPYQNVHIVLGDFLKLDLHELWRTYFREDDKVNVVANLPYYITTPVIMKLLEAKLPWEHIVVMIQKEVAERLSAGPGSKQYGSLSIAVQYYCRTEIVANVPRTVFIPEPNVDSAVVKLTLRDRPPVHVENEDHFFAVVRSCFFQRRKTIANNLLGSPFIAKKDVSRQSVESVLRKADIDPSRRGETLSIEEFARLSNTMFKEI